MIPAALAERRVRRGRNALHGILGHWHHSPPHWAGSCDMLWSAAL